MAEAGELTFAFGADFSGFTREIDTAGAKLDALSRTVGRWPGTVAGGPLQLTGAMQQAAGALAAPKPAATSATDDDQADKELSRLANQLALLQSTGAAHDAIAERMRIETEQAKLGTDATAAQKQAVADLVTQIDAARASQQALATQQQATNDAWSFGANTVTRGLDALLVRGQTFQSVARSLVSSFAQQGLSAALTGGGSFAGLFGTANASGGTGGLFGALQSLFAGGLGGSASSGLSSLNAAFSCLYANGGIIGSGQWGIVGEKGAEVVAGPAAVTPWSKLPSGRAGAPGGTTHQTINFNVTSPDAPSFARSQSQVAAVLAAAVGRGQRNS